METYDYYGLPFCEPPGGVQRAEPSLTDALTGFRPVATPYVLPFRNDINDTLLCEVTLNSTQIDTLRHAVEDDYYFQALYAGLPIWGFIGRQQLTHSREGGEGGPGRQLLLFTHLSFTLSYNADQVVEVNVATEPYMTVEVGPPTGAGPDGLVVRFSYSARWEESSISFGHRMDRYMRLALAPYHMQAHWRAVITLGGILLSLVLTCAMLSSRIKLCNGQPTAGGWPAPAAAPQGACALQQASIAWPPAGPPPPRANLLSAAVGVGSQLLAVAAGLAALGMLGLVGPYSRGRLQLACLLLYAGTGGVAGYVSGLHYRAFGGSHWVANALLCTLLYGGPALLVFAVTNTVAAAYGSTAALPPGAIVAVLSVWALLGAPLTALGSLLAARRGEPSPELGCPGTPAKFAQQPAAAVSDSPRAPWHRSVPASVPLQMVLAGCLPFAAACLELDYVISSMWSHKVYIIPGLHSLIFALLVGVSAASTVIVTIFQLTLLNGRIRWEWRSFLCGGSTGIFMYGYCIYIFFARPASTAGCLQVAYYFGYNALLCYAVFLALGSAGFTASRLFLRALAGRCR